MEAIEMIVCDGGWLATEIGILGLSHKVINY